MDTKEEQILKELNYVVKNTDEAMQLRLLLEFNEGRLMGWSFKDARKYLISNAGSATILSKLRNVTHICTIAWNTPGKYRLHNEKFIKRWLKEFVSGGQLSTEMAVQEKEVWVDKLREEYSKFVSSAKENDVDKWASEIKDVDVLIEYTKHIMGDLYLDALLPILQQYSMADTPIYAKNGDKLTKREHSGFSLAYFGDPGAGKTFATDDLLRGNEREGVPPHGIIGKLRYAEGMTPKQFIAILEAYQNYPVDWIIPEFRDFFRYPGMVEKLKLVMERREVSDETRTTKIGPYKVTSFFIVNYNTKLGKNGYKATMSDPNFEAVEDRMICKLFINTNDRYKMILDNMLRRSRGEIDYYLADTLRKHITYTYHKLVSDSPKIIIDTSDFEELAKWTMNMKEQIGAKVSLRILSRAMQIAASAALVSYLHLQKEFIPIGQKHLDIAKEFIKQEMMSRALRA